MNKASLIEAVAKTLGSKAAPGAVEAVLDAIARELADRGTAAVTGFGTFKTVTTQARKARNPQTGESVTVPARTKVRFVPGQNLADLANGDKAVPLNGSAISKAPKGSLVGGAR
ncbi:HU family DNA-binding protein [Streptacidiphilus sp. PAMC 29251]